MTTLTKQGREQAGEEERHQREAGARYRENQHEQVLCRLYIDLQDALDAAERLDVPYQQRGKKHRNDDLERSLGAAVLRIARLRCDTLPRSLAMGERRVEQVRARLEELKGAEDALFMQSLGKEFGDDLARL